MTRSLPHALLRAARAIAPAVAGLLGAWIAMSAFGAQEIVTGPFLVRLDGGFGPSVTDVELPPFGELRADTHSAPLRYTVTLEDVRVPELSSVIAESGIEGLVADVERDGKQQLVPFMLRLFALAVLGAMVAAFGAFRTRWREVGIGVLAAAVVVGGSQLIAWGTYRTSAFASPAYSGSLSLAPRLIGPVRRASDRIEDFRAELERIVEGATRAYTSIRTATIDGADVVSVLHVSDVHLSPLGQDFTTQIAEGFDVDVVLDTGDLTSFGTQPEQFVLREIRDLGRPYVFVRGNHDSRALQSAMMEEVPNAVVLDGSVREVAGLSFYGLGHPVFTPDASAPVDDPAFADAAREAGKRVAQDVAALPEPPDVLAVHDDRMAEEVAGLVPLVVSGHFHEPGVAVERGTLFLRIGSTGGSGFEVFTQEGGIPLSAEVLYFSRGAQPGLVAWDAIEQSPESGSLTVQRHVVEEELGQLTPTPPPTASETAPGSPSP